MCVVCGCGESTEHPARIEKGGHGGERTSGEHGSGERTSGERTSGEHTSGARSSSDGGGGRSAGSAATGAYPTTLDFSANAARVSVPGMSTARAIRLEEDVLGANNRVAALNRSRFEEHGVLALNLVSSPGSGKTTLLCETLLRLQRASPELGLLVIEGDQQSRIDAERIGQTGVAAVQVNTGKGCHLDAPMVERAFTALHAHLPHAHHHHPHPQHAHHHHAHLPHAHHHHPHPQHAHHHHPHPPHVHHDPSHAPPNAVGALLFIENVGNLVCPALWDLGEDAKVVVLSVTEGEDKPLKYPDMFAAASLMLLNKVDLLAHVRFDADRCEELARQISPGISILRVSAYTGEGMDAWLGWLGSALAQKRERAQRLRAQRLRQSIAALQEELAQFEARELPASN